MNVDPGRESESRRKVVELVGPAGVGKTTTLSALENVRRRQGWSTLRQAEYEWSRPAGLRRIKWHARNFVRRPAKVDNSSLYWGKALRLIAENKEYANLVWERIGRHRAPNGLHGDLRFLTARHVCTAFGRYQAIQESESPGLVLLDEGLIQKTTVLVGDNPTSEDVREVLSLTPAPAAVIALEATPTVLAERAWSRPKVTWEQQHMSREELLASCVRSVRRMAMICSELERLGVAVFHIDTERHQATTATMRITEYLENCATQPA